MLMNYTIKLAKNSILYVIYLKTFPINVLYIFPARE